MGDGVHGEASSIRPPDHLHFFLPLVVNHLISSGPIDIDDVLCKIFPDAFAITESNGTNKRVLYPLLLPLPIPVHRPDKWPRSTLPLRWLLPLSIDHDHRYQRHYNISRDIQKSDTKLVIAFVEKIDWSLKECYF